MVYSCAIWRGGEKKTLEEAQEEKLETVARKLAAEGGRPRPRRRLRLGRLPALGGDQARRQRRRHHPLPAQAEKARQRAEEAGVADRVEIRVMDYRDLAPPGERFDAIASIGMVEHVGASQIEVYAADPRRAAGAGRAAAQPRHHPPAPHRRRGRALLRALRLPRRRPAAPLAQPAGAGTGRLRHPPRRGLRPRLLEDPARLGRQPRREPAPRRSGSPAPNGSASGASTCAPPATASTAASSTSTKPAAPRPDRGALTKQVKDAASEACSAPERPRTPTMRGSGRRAQFVPVDPAVAGLRQRRLRGAAWRDGDQLADVGLAVVAGEALQGAGGGAARVKRVSPPSLR